jgi:hypothetical protein
LKDYFFNNIAFGQFRFAELLSLCNSPLGARKKDWLSRRAGFCCFATANRILRERELFFEPRGAWQILLKSDLSARRARAEARSAEATNAEHTIWLRILNEIRTFFKENPEQE